MQNRLALPGILSAVARGVRWHRRLLAALLAGLAVLTGLNAVRPERTPTVAVVAAGRDLPGGVTLAAGDLVQVQLPAPAVPAGAARSPSEVVGKAINGPLARFSVVTAASVSTGPELARPGFVVLPLPVSNAALRPLLTPGRHVDVLNSEGGKTIASNVRIVAFPSEKDAGLFATGASATPLLAEVTPAQAGALASVVARGAPVIVLR